MLMLAWIVAIGFTTFYLALRVVDIPQKYNEEPKVKHLNCFLHFFIVYLK
jgi:hypothetical protein